MDRWKGYPDPADCRKIGVLTLSEQRSLESCFSSETLLAFRSAGFDVLTLADLGSDAE